MVKTNRLLDVQVDEATAVQETEVINFDSKQLTVTPDISNGKANVTVNKKGIQITTIPLILALG
jgi:hypothetical protein